MAAVIVSASDWINKVHVGDCRRLMRAMIGDGVRVQCVVTSPPYWGLRDYGVPGQFGLERSWIRHVARMRGVFRLVREVLRDDGTLWMNYGDSYYSPQIGGGIGENSTINGQGSQQAVRDAKRAMRGKQVSSLGSLISGANRRRGQRGLKPKDLVGMPWRIALTLQADGWYLRSEIIWHKPNPMPESITDRPTKAHEHVFLLSRSESYYYDQGAIKEPSSRDSHARASRARLKGYAPPGQREHHGIVGPRPGVNPKAHDPAPSGWAQGAGVSHSAKDHARAKKGLRDSTKFGRGAGWRNKQNASFSEAVVDLVQDRNARTVWTIPTQPFPGAHFATFPEALVARCILAGSRPGDVIFDPFMGSGTVAKVAEGLGRKFIGCELNPEYAAMYGTLRPAQTGMELTASSLSNEV